MSGERTRAMLVSLMVVLAACGAAGTPGAKSQTPNGTATTIPSPSPEPPSPVLAVAVLGFNGGAPPPTYKVELINSNGYVVASANAAKRLIHSDVTDTLPETSTSSTRLYFLDGDSAVRFLDADGSSGVATRIPVGTNAAATSARGTPADDVQAAFAVSPDDKRIAVAIVRSTGIRLYVEDLNGANHVELYSGPVIEWPVAWWHGQLVLQLAESYQYVRYGSLSGYHVVSALTAKRSAAVCAAGLVEGLLSPAGTLCTQGTMNGPLQMVDLAGNAKPVAGVCNGQAPFPVALSLDGASYASTDCATGRLLVVYGIDGSIHPINIEPPTLGGPGTGRVGLQPSGWLDVNHVVIGGGSFCSCQMYIADLTTGFISPPTQEQAMFVGTVPSQVS